MLQFSDEGRQTRRVEVEMSYGKGGGAGPDEELNLGSEVVCRRCTQEAPGMTNCKGILFVGLRI